MIIENVRMENFKSHRNTSVDLSTGISIVMGENGAGKSSILEAVSFALFKQHSGKKMEQLIRNNTEKMSVTLTFLVNGRKYRIKRDRNKKSGAQAKLGIMDGESFMPLASGEKAVTEEVKRLLEMDGDLFLNAVYVRQGEIADLIEKSPSEKKQMIGKLLGIESLEKAWKNMKILMDEYNGKKLKLEGRLESLDGLKDDLNSADNDKKRIHKRIQELNEKILKLETEYQSLKDRNEILDSKRSDFEATTSALESRKNLLEKMEVDEKYLRAKVDEIEATEKRMKELKPKIDKLPVLKGMQEAADELKGLKKEEIILNKIIKDINGFRGIITSNESYYHDYLKLESEVCSLQYARDQFAGSRGLMVNYVDRRKKVQNKIEQSMQKVSDVLEKSNKILNTDFDSVEDVETHLKAVKPEVEARVKEAVEDIHKLQTEISNIKIQNKGLETPIKELNQVEDVCPICKSNITPQKREELLKEYTSEMENNRKRSSELGKRLKELKVKKGIFESKSLKIQDINLGIITEYMSAVEDSKKDIGDIDSKVVELKKNLDIFEDLNNDIKTKNKVLEDLKGQYEAYIGAKNSLESLKDPEKYEEDLAKIQYSIETLKTRISSFVDIAGGSVENLQGEINYLEGLNNEYHQLSGAVIQKESFNTRLMETVDGIGKAREKMFEMGLQLETIGYDEKAHEIVKKDLDTKNGLLNDLKGEKQRFKGEEAQITRSIEEIHKKIESYSFDEKKLSGLKDYLKLLDYIRDLYGKDGVQRDLRNLSRPLIEQNTRDFFEKFNFEYSDIKLDEDYDVTIYGPAGQNSLDMISGGEKIAVALALRLGITQTLSGGSLELIMLDEPTIHLDAYRRQELIELLKKMSIIPQMIIVTHETDLEDAADHILRVKKEEGESFVVNS
ncbi:AAA family ATPase [Methanobacterium aggregans]|nr:AAA family ATPase [Methanobacterium aggregans]MBP2045437.1 exonuclease SbcC [Methanobacterium aggregans]